MSSKTPVTAPRSRPPRPAPRRAEAVGPEDLASPTRRSVLLGISAALVVASVLQTRGLLVSDTKLDLVIEPIRWLARPLHLWEPLQSFGQIQNQAVGYLFPMGPFFALAKLVLLPMWIAQRLWLAVILVAAFWGAVRVADALSVGTPTTRVVAGLAYALAPTTLALVGFASAAVLPSALMPWALLPLVAGSRRGSPARAAALSGLAVLAMGGNNAVATGAALVLPGLFLLTRQRGPRRRRLVGWWVVAVVLASLWWFGGLLFQNLYGFDFLPYTERAAASTSTLSAVEVLRGTSNWLNYFTLGHPASPAGRILVSQPLVIMSVAATAALGLYGIARVDMPERNLFMIAVAVVFLLLTASYIGPWGGPLAQTYRRVLDGPLAPLRNLGKFDLSLRLALTLGLAHALSRWRLVRRRRGRRLVRRRRGRRLVPIVNATVALAAVALVLLSAAPLFAQRLYRDGSFAAIPSYWYDAAAFLRENGASTRSLMVPAAAFGEYTWGRSLDEPFQPLLGTPWAVRHLVPLGGAGSIRLMDVIERAIEERGSAPGLADLLARSGVGYVVVRNDLDLRSSGAPRPTTVTAALVRSGLHRVTGFGPRIHLSILEQLELVAAGIAPDEAFLQPVEVYSSGRPAPLVSTYAQDDALLVSGGVEALLPLSDRGLLGDRAVVMSGDQVAPVDGQQQWVMSDGDRRRDISFGLVRTNYSYVFTPDELVVGTDYGPRQFSPRSAAVQSVARLEGAARVTASSYGSWLVHFPEMAPAKAFDGDLSTVWSVGDAKGAQGHWVEIGFDEPIPVSTVSVAPITDPGWPLVTRVRVTTDAGWRESELKDTDAPQVVAVAEGPTHFVRVTIEGVGPATGVGLAGGFREITIPGVAVRRPLAVPHEQEAAYSRAQALLPVFVFERGRINPITNLLRRDEEPQLDRLFLMPREGNLGVAGTAVAVGGPALDFVLEGLRSKSAFPLGPDDLVRSDCGQGPAILVDGEVHPTAVEGRLSEVEALRPVTVIPCGGGVQLSAGEHRLRADDSSSAFSLAGVTLLPADLHQEGGQAPRVSVVDFGQERRLLDVGPGGPAYLVVHENFNKGWSATLDGQRLQAIRLDGWQQGFVLPAGAGGRVEVRFGPGAWYRVGLLVGALAVVALVLRSLWPVKEGPGLRPAGPRQGPGPVVALTVTAAVLLLTGGAAAVLLIPLALLAYWWKGILAWLGLMLALGAGVVVALQPGRYPSQAEGAFGAPAQILALAAVAALLVNWAMPARYRRARWGPAGRRNTGS